LVLRWRYLSRYDFDLAVDIIRAVRDAVGPPVDLLIEGHSRFNVATAVEFAEAIHQFRPTWFEEPVPHTNIPAIVEVARRSPVPIATGESLSTKQQFAELLKHEDREHPAAGFLPASDPTEQADLVAKSYPASSLFPREQLKFCCRGTSLSRVNRILLAFGNARGERLQVQSCGCRAGRRACLPPLAGNDQSAPWASRPCPCGL
jgi:hypothetical protein